MKLHIVFLICIFTVTFSDGADIKELKPNVNELNLFTQQNPMVFVYFYRAPENCTDCEVASKNFEKTAEKFATQAPSLVFAKIDGSTIGTDLYEHEVYSYPFFRFYKNSKGYSFEQDYIKGEFDEFLTEKVSPDFPPPNRVIILSASNFTEVVKKEPLILVEFFAPWCGHCKQLAPEYEKAAYQLSKLDQPIPLATVDATVETELAKEYDIQGYPTLKVFRRGTPSEYKGPREHKGIVQFMKKAKEPAAKTITSARELMAYQNGAKPFILGLFSSPQDPLIETYLLASEYFRDKADALKTFSDDVVSKFRGEGSRVVVVQPNNFHSHYESPFASHTIDPATDTVESLKQFILSNLIPFVGHFTHQNKEFFDEVMKDKNQPLCLFFMQVDFSKDSLKHTITWRNKILDAVFPFKEEMRFGLADESEWASMVKDFGFDDAGEDLSVGCFHQSSVGAAKQKYRMEPMDEFDADHIRSFLNKLKEGKLVPHLKSAIAPVRYDGHFRPVVGSNVESVVFDGKTTALVYLYSQFCKECKKLYPSLETTATKLLSQPATKSLHFVKLETSLNDYPNPPFEVKDVDAPTFYLVLGGSRDNTVRFPGDAMSTEELKTFIQNQLPGRSEEL